MSNTRSLQDASFDELRQILIDKRRKLRQARLSHYRKSGKFIPDASMQVNLQSEATSFSYKQVLTPETTKTEEVKQPKTWMDRFLFFIEVAAALGLLFILIYGITTMRNLNREVASALQQPTLTPTALIMAVVLPSGHTPPNAEGGVQPNEAEIPEHLRPLVQSLANLPVPTPGPRQAIRIQIPAINVDRPIVQGDGWEQLKKGVGQRVGTPNPGDIGNIVLSAHNDIFGEIFKDLDQLKQGDTITLFTSQQTYTYVVRQTQVVEPTQVEVMAPSQESIITLISCYPYMVDNQRIVVSADLKN